MVASGAVFAWFVADAASATPGTQYQANHNNLLAIGALCVTAYFVERETGVRFRKMGLKAWALLAAVMIWTLLMFSVALGLVSLGHRLWIAVPILLTWVIGTLGSAGVFRTCVESMRHG